VLSRVALAVEGGVYSPRDSRQ